jgi:hypothetical protein
MPVEFFLGKRRSLAVKYNQHGFGLRPVWRPGSGRKRGTFQHSINGLSTDPPGFAIRRVGLFI